MVLGREYCASVVSFGPAWTREYWLGSVVCFGSFWTTEYCAVGSAVVVKFGSLLTREYCPLSSVVSAGTV